MLTLMFILLAAAAGHALALGRRLPAIPVLIGMGVLLDAAGLVGSLEVRQDALRLGLFVVLFAVGAELDPAIAGPRRRSSAALVVGHLVLFGSLGAAAAVLLDLDLRTGAYLALAATGSSTLLVVALVRRREEAFEPTGRTVMGVALLQDVLIVLGLAVVSADGPLEAGLGVAGTGSLLGLAWISSRSVIPWAVERLEVDGEALLLFMLAALFVFAGLSSAMGVSPEVGAFIAGLAFSRFPVDGLVRAPLSSMSSFFLAVFCVTLGSFVRIADASELLLPVLFVAAILIVGPLLLVPLGRATGLGARTSIEVSGLLAQIGEMSIAVIVVGVGLGHVSEDVFRAVVLVAVITMSIAPILSADSVSWRLMRRLSRAPARSDDETTSAGRVLFLGCGTSTRQLIRQMQAVGRPVLAVDDDPAIVAMLRSEGVAVLRGDGADPHVLHRLGLRRAVAVVSTMRRRVDHERVLRLAGDVPVIVRTFEPGSARRLEAAGATVVCESELAAEACLEWFDAWGNEAEPAGRPDTGSA